MGEKEQMKETSNIEHRTSNIESPGSAASFGVGRWAFDVPRLLWRLLDLVIAAIFIYAGVLKALDPVQLAHDIDHYKILPWTVGVGLAFYLPWLEIFCGLALIFRLFYRGALSILTALVVIFLVATIAAKVRGLDITCGCFGHASQNWSFPMHLALDLAILVALAVLCYCSVARARTNSSPAPTWQGLVPGRHDQET
jgi:putative oxidoreductase